MRKVLYHANCLDGFAAAMAVWMRFGDERTEYIPVVTDEPLPSGMRAERVGSEIVIVDYSYPRAVLEELGRTVRKVIVLDHHKTAEEALRGEIVGVTKVFDMEKSGCRLAWEYFHPDADMPRLFEYVEDRDLWRFRLPDTKRVTAGLWLLERKFEIWAGFLTEVWELETAGAVAEKVNKGLVEQAILQSTMARIAGYLVPIVNATCLRSEIGEALNLKYPECAFSAVYSMIRAAKEGEINTGTKVKWSLRSSPPGGCDCSAIAKLFGGGGHAGAAGFVTETVGQAAELWNLELQGLGGPN